MPRLNLHGDVVMGAAGGPASVNGVQIPVPSGLAVWMDADRIVVQEFSGTPRAAVLNVRSGEIHEAELRGVNQLAGGGGRWVGADNAGVFGSINKPGYSLGLTEQDGRGAIGPEGTIAIVKHGGVGFELHSPSGGVVEVGGVLARGLCVLGPGRAIWHDDAGRISAIGVEQPAQLPTATNLKVADVAGVPWLVSFCGAIGLVAHPWDSLIGVRLTGAGQGAFYPDAMAINGRLVVVWSNGPGELPSDRRGVVDALALPRVDLLSFLAPIDEPKPPPPTEPNHPPTEPEKPKVRAFTDAERDILNRIGQKYEALRRGDDDQRRDFTLRAAQQLAFSISREWGTKRADPGRPPSKDSVAMVVNGQLCAADIINGSTREMQFPDLEPIPGQVFIEVGPVDHLGAGHQEPEQPNTPPPAALESRLVAIENRLKTLGEEAQDQTKATLLLIGDLADKLDKRPAGGFDADDWETETPLKWTSPLTGRIKRKGSR